MKYGVTLLLAITASFGLRELRAGEHPMMEDLGHPPATGSNVTLVRKSNIDPIFFDEYNTLIDFALILSAKDEVGLKELHEQRKCRDAKVGTTALILAQFDKPIPSAHIRFTSGPDKDKKAFVPKWAFETLIPTRLDVGETGVLGNEAPIPTVVGQTEPGQVNLYHATGDYSEYIKDALERTERGVRVTRFSDGIVTDELDGAYIKRGKLILLPVGVRVKVLEYLSPADHPMQSRTLAHVEITTKLKDRKKIQGTKGYVLAFNVYKVEEGKAKRKGAR